MKETHFIGIMFVGMLGLTLAGLYAISDFSFRTPPEAEQQTTTLRPTRHINLTRARRFPRPMRVAGMVEVAGALELDLAGPLDPTGSMAMPALGEQAAGQEKHAALREQADLVREAGLARHAMVIRQPAPGASAQSSAAKTPGPAIYDSLADHLLSYDLSRAPAGSYAAMARPYQKFLKTIGYVEKQNFMSSKGIRIAIDSLRINNSRQFVRGWMNYKAMQMAYYRPMIRTVESGNWKQGMLQVDLAAAKPLKKLNGSYEMMAVLLKSVQADQRRLEALSERLLAAAYKLAQADMPAPGSLMALETAARQARQAAAGLAGTAVDMIFPAAQAQSLSTISVLSYILILSTHIVVDGHDAQSGKDDILMSNKYVDRCFRFANLNVNQCLAVAHNNSERAFCAGKHSTDEVAQCLVKFSH